MGLAVTIFVPEGIVIVSDRLAIIRNAEKDTEFLQHKQKTMFSFNGRFLVCVQDTGYVGGLPLAYYVERIFYKLKGESVLSTLEFISRFKEELENYNGLAKNLLCYIAGNDVNEYNTISPMIYLLEHGRTHHINRAHNGESVYNYHAIGNNFWVNKLLLPTNYKSTNNNTIEFDALDIDFSKYSISEAIDFGKSLLAISTSMYKFAQLNPKVGEYISIGYITIADEIMVKHLND